MGKLYQSEKIHPLQGRQAVRQTYVALLREVAGAIEQDEQVELPVTIMAGLAGAPASDYSHIVMVCFERRTELDFVGHFFANLDKLPEVAYAPLDQD